MPIAMAKELETDPSSSNTVIPDPKEKAKRGQKGVAMEAGDTKEEGIGTQDLAVEDQEMTEVIESGTKVRSLEDSREATNKMMAKEVSVEAKATTKSETKRHSEALELRPRLSVITSSTEP